MLEILRPYILTFIPIFVAVDAIGNIPVFISLVEGLNKKQRDKIITDSVTTATLLAVIFMFLGEFILRLLNITIADFQIAGGALLFVISVRLLLPGVQRTTFLDKHEKDVGVFPLGTPLITGPAVLTTAIMMRDTFGILPTFISLLVNMFFVWLCFFRADFIIKIIGASGTRAFSKVTFILLAAIAAMMVRHGIYGAFLK
jgi:multiple antibiotic resistance protein